MINTTFLKLFIFATGKNAQRRFSPSEAYAGTLYKVKHPEKFNGYQYPKPAGKII